MNIFVCLYGNTASICCERWRCRRGGWWQTGSYVLPHESSLPLRCPHQRFDIACIDDAPPKGEQFQSTLSAQCGSNNFVELSVLYASVEIVDPIQKRSFALALLLFCCLFVNLYTVECVLLCCAGGSGGFTFLYVVWSSKICSKLRDQLPLFVSVAKA